MLEHNHYWNKILSNATNSFKKRMVLIVFTPFAKETSQIGTMWAGIPDISFKKDDLTRFFNQFKYVEETLETDTQYGTESLFYIEK